VIELDPARLDVRVESTGDRRVPAMVLDDGAVVVSVPAAGGWAWPRAAVLISRALADLGSSGFGQRLRELCRARGISGPVLARRAKFSRGYMWELSAGRKSPSVEAAELLDDLLGAGGDLIALAAGERPTVGVGVVRAGETRLTVRASERSSLVTLTMDSPASGDSATLALLRELALTGRVRAEVSLNGAQAVELLRLLGKAVATARRGSGEHS
jgi:transcriptional regulator with XRE-family HTH domain